MDDLISRQAAIDALDALCDRECEYSKQQRSFMCGACRLGSAFDVIDELPSAQPEQQWIPVSEALPKDGVTVWVTIKGHDVIRCEEGETLEQAIDRISKIRWVTQGYWSEEEHGWNDPSFGCPLMVQPIAWMPMEVPEPYKEGQDEDD